MRGCAALVASAVPYAGVVRSRTPSGAGIQLSWTALQGMLRPLRYLIYCRAGRLVDVSAECCAISVVVQLEQSRERKLAAAMVPLALVLAQPVAARAVYSAFLAVEAAEAQAVIIALSLLQ